MSEYPNTHADAVHGLNLTSTKLSLKTHTRCGVIELSREPELSNVLEDDKMIVRNVLYCISSLNSIQNICDECDVLHKNDSYIVTCNLGKVISVRVFGKNCLQYLPQKLT